MVRHAAALVCARADDQMLATRKCMHNRPHRLVTIAAGANDPDVRPLERLDESVGPVIERGIVGKDADVDARRMQATDTVRVCIRYLMPFRSYLSLRVML